MLVWIIASFTGLLLVSALFPDLPIGKSTRRILVEEPAAWMNSASLRQLIIAGIVMLAVVLLCAAAPEWGPMLLDLAIGGDIALYIDIMAVASVAFLGIKLNSVRQAFRSLLGRSAPPIGRSSGRARAKSSPRSRPRRPIASNDDEPAPETSIAA